MATIFCSELLYIHVPKTGGVSVTEYLLHALPRPLFYVHPAPLRQVRDDAGVTHIEGRSHYTLDKVSPFLVQHGFDLSTFPCVLAVIRNPYDLAVSHYSYFRKPDMRAERIGPLQILARTASFRDFVLNGIRDPTLNFMGSFYRFYHLNDRIPDNLRVIRFENLAEDTKDSLRLIGIESKREFPWLNQSERGDYRSYYDEELEEAIYSKNKWMFDEGFYERLRLDEVVETA